jgi:hypothetical protein
MSPVKLLQNRKLSKIKKLKKKRKNLKNLFLVSALMLLNQNKQHQEKK